MLRKGRYSARLAETPAEVAAAQALRHLCFRGRPGRDADAFDAVCRHLLVEDQADAALVGCCRVMRLASGAELGASYAAQSYDLSALAGFDRPMLELGRFCTHPDRSDPDILRIAWGALTQLVDGEGIGLMFGCTSFAGTDPAPYRDAFALLRSAHLAPPRLAPRPRAPQTYPFARDLAGHLADARRAAQVMPPLLRTYLMMGGWVSDHAVIDPDLNTLHVFTALDIAAVPASRARALRLIAG